MIKIKTDCSKYIHEHVCKNKNNPKLIGDKLSNMQFGNGPNDDYNWDTMVESYHVNIDISCSEYENSDYWSNR